MGRGGGILDFFKKGNSPSRGGSLSKNSSANKKSFTSEPSEVAEINKQIRTKTLESIFLVFQENEQALNIEYGSMEKLQALLSKEDRISIGDPNVFSSKKEFNQEFAKFVSKRIFEKGSYNQKDKKAAEFIIEHLYDAQGNSWPDDFDIKKVLNNNALDEAMNQFKAESLDTDEYKKLYEYFTEDLLDWEVYYKNSVDNFIADSFELDTDSEGLVVEDIMSKSMEDTIIEQINNDLPYIKQSIKTLNQAETADLIDLQQAVLRGIPSRHNLSESVLRNKSVNENLSEEVSAIIGSDNLDNPNDYQRFEQTINQSPDKLITALEKEGKVYNDDYNPINQVCKNSMLLKSLLKVDANKIATAYKRLM